MKRITKLFLHTIKIISLIGLLLFFSCENLDDNIQGGWVIDQAYYNNTPVTWDLYSNGISLNKDYTCVLPIGSPEKRHSIKETGTWIYFKKGNENFIKIKTTNEYFNNTFKIQNIHKERDSVSFGFFLKMTLISDNIQLDCTKVLYE